MNTSPILQRGGRFPAVILLVPLLAAGCATTTRVALGDVERGQLKAVAPVASLVQQEIGVTIVRSKGGAGFGLIGAIVDSAVDNKRAKTAEGAVIPLRDALVGQDARALLRAALERELSAVPWIAATETRLEAAGDDASIRRLLEPGDRNVLLVSASYRLSPKFEEIVVSAKVWLLPKKVAADASPTEAAIYRNSFHARASLPKEKVGGTLEANAIMWSDGSGKLGRAAIEQGVAEVARMVAYDLAENAPPGNDYSKIPAGATRVPVLAPETGAVLEGFAARREGGRTWVRVRSGELHAIGAVPE